MAHHTNAMSDALPTPLGTVLVTGGCGFLGSHIVDQLLYRYPPNTTSVHVLDLRVSQNNFPNAHYHPGDLTDPASVRTILESVKPDVILHTASPVAVGNDSSAAKARSEALMRKVNIEGTRILLEESQKVGVKAFVYTSSASVISDVKTDLVNADERYGLVMGDLQREYYSHTKAVAEQLVLSSNTPPKFLTCALRPSGIFGERDVQAIPNILNVVRTGRTGFQLGPNDNMFDWTYVGNVAHAHCLAAERLLERFASLSSSSSNVAVVIDQKGPEPSKTSTDEEEKEDRKKVEGEAFFITNTSPVYFWDFTRSVWAEYSRLSGEKYPAVASLSSIRILPYWFAISIATIAVWVMWCLGQKPPKLTPPQVRYSCMTRYFSTKKAMIRLGYAPVWELDEGVKRTVGWFWEVEKGGSGKMGI